MLLRSHDINSAKIVEISSENNGLSILYNLFPILFEKLRQLELMYTEIKELSDNVSKRSKNNHQKLASNTKNSAVKSKYLANGAIGKERKYPNLYERQKEDKRKTKLKSSIEKFKTEIQQLLANCPTILNFYFANLFDPLLSNEFSMSFIKYFTQKVEDFLHKLNENSNIIRSRKKMSENSEFLTFYPVQKDFFEKSKVREISGKQGGTSFGSFKIVKKPFTSFFKFMDSKDHSLFNLPQDKPEASLVKKNTVVFVKRSTIEYSLLGYPTNSSQAEKTKKKDFKMEKEIESRIEETLFRDIYTLENKIVSPSIASSSDLSQSPKTTKLRKPEIAISPTIDSLVASETSNLNNLSTKSISAHLESEDGCSMDEDSNKSDGFESDNSILDGFVSDPDTFDTFDSPVTSRQRNSPKHSNTNNIFNELQNLSLIRNISFLNEQRRKKMIEIAKKPTLLAPTPDEVAKIRLMMDENIKFGGNVQELFIKLLGYYSNEKKDRASIYLSKNDSSTSKTKKGSLCLVLEKLDLDFIEFLQYFRSELDETRLKMIIFQVVFSLAVIQSFFNFQHADLHLKNIMLKIYRDKSDCVSGNQFEYCEDENEIRMKTLADKKFFETMTRSVCFSLNGKNWKTELPFMIKIIDYGNAKFVEKENAFSNEDSNEGPAENNIPSNSDLQSSFSQYLNWILKNKTSNSKNDKLDEKDSEKSKNDKKSKRGDSNLIFPGADLESFMNNLRPKCPRKNSLIQLSASINLNTKPCDLLNHSFFDSLKISEEEISQISKEKQIQRIVLFQDEEKKEKETQNETGSPKIIKNGKKTEENKTENETNQEKIGIEKGSEKCEEEEKRMRFEKEKEIERKKRREISKKKKEKQKSGPETLQNHEENDKNTQQVDSIIEQLATPEKNIRKRQHCFTNDNDLNDDDYSPFSPYGTDNKKKRKKTPTKAESEQLATPEALTTIYSKSTKIDAEKQENPENVEQNPNERSPPLRRRRRRIVTSSSDLIASSIPKDATSNSIENSTENESEKKKPRHEFEDNQNAKIVNNIFEPNEHETSDPQPIETENLEEKVNQNTETEKTQHEDNSENEDQAMKEPEKQNGIIEASEVQIFSPSLPPILPQTDHCQEKQQVEEISKSNEEKYVLPTSQSPEEEECNSKSKTNRKKRVIIRHHKKSASNEKSMVQNSSEEKENEENGDKKLNVTKDTEISAKTPERDQDFVAEGNSPQKIEDANERNQIDSETHKCAAILIEIEEEKAEITAFDNLVDNILDDESCDLDKQSLSIDANSTTETDIIDLDDEIYPQKIKNQQKSVIDVSSDEEMESTIHSSSSSSANSHQKSSNKRILDLDESQSEHELPQDDDVEFLGEVPNTERISNRLIAAKSKIVTYIKDLV